MKLGGIKIINLNSLKGKFDLKEVWGNIGNGVLLDCQRELAEQGAELAGLITEILERLEQKEGLEKIISAFYNNKNWDLEKLRMTLKLLSAKSRDHGGNDFYSRNEKMIQNLVEFSGIDWEEEKANLFFLFLLLMLQVKPREEILEKEFVFIRKELLKDLGEGKEIEQKGKGARLYPYASGVLYLKDGKILNEKGKLFSPEQEEIDFFTFTEGIGILAFTKQGEISDCTEVSLRYEIEECLKGLEGTKQSIAMTAAYGKNYLLLTTSGRVISNVSDSMEDWKELCWVGAGLNSLTAIREKNRNLLELGSDEKITEFSGVKAAYTWSGWKNHYGILKQNGSLIMDDGIVEKHVSAANIDRDGYTYAIGRELIFRRFGSEFQNIKYEIPYKGQITEVCKHQKKFYYLVTEGTGEELGIFE